MAVQQMQQRREWIDAIALRKGRAVLYLEFHPLTVDGSAAYRYQSDAVRRSVLDWLDAHGMPWSECGPIAEPRVRQAYLGQVYLDVPFDETLPRYRALRDFLEHPDGRMRHTGVRFYAMPLAYAKAGYAALTLAY